MKGAHWLASAPNACLPAVWWQQLAPTAVTNRQGGGRVRAAKVRTIVDIPRAAAVAGLRALARATPETTTAMWAQALSGCGQQLQVCHCFLSVRCVWMFY